jgi:hypothetical protein
LNSQGFVRIGQHLNLNARLGFLKLAGIPQHFVFFERLFSLGVSAERFAAALAVAIVKRNLEAIRRKLAHTAVTIFGPLFGHFENCGGLAHSATIEYAQNLPSGRAAR